MSGSFKRGSKIRAIRDIDTGFSKTFAVGKQAQRVLLDPSIRDIENDVLGRLGGLFERFQQLPDAVVSPFRRNLEKARARIARGFQRRGLTGTLAGRFLQSEARQDETEAGELLGRTLFQTGKAEQSVLESILGLSAQRTERELRSLGVGTDIGAQVLRARIARAEAEGRDLDRILGIAGRGLGALGS